MLPTWRSRRPRTHPRWSRTSAAGICAATSASATSASIVSTTCSTATTRRRFRQLNFNTAGIFGLGVGYKVNNWFRADVTGEYRGNSQFFGTDRITYAGGVGTDTYHATKNEWVVLANAYVDLGTWWCITPFIGAGVGGARVAINGFTDQGIASNPVQPGPALAGIAFGDNVSKWNFAWAAHAGLAYKVTPNFTVELAYRYLDMGDGLTGDLRAFDGTNNINNPTTFKHITSHDLKLGVRWDLTQPAGLRAAADPQRLIATSIR